VLIDGDWIVNSRAEELVRYVARGVELSTRMLEDAGRDLTATLTRLRTLSPRATLERGYAIVQLEDGTVVTQPDDAKPDAALKLTLAKGVLAAVSKGNVD
jgi:exodeoxyribonuclease VII large subunit